MAIKDSGERSEFATGAVRDIQKGKGRCDLMPLDVVAMIMDPDDVIPEIAEFVETGDQMHLQIALGQFDGYPTWPDVFLEVSKHFEEGAEKYGENNWQKGLPVKCYINSAVRHYLKWLRGDKDEHHDRAFCWNVICAIWTCKHKPELNDYATKECHVCGKKIQYFAKSCDNCKVYQHYDSEENLCELEEEY